MEKRKYEWIPVEDSLPPWGEEVLTQLNDDEMRINHIIDDDTNEWFFENVVAWMPLPMKYIKDHACCYWEGHCTFGYDECPDSYECEDFD